MAEESLNFSDFPANKRPRLENNDNDEQSDSCYSVSEPEFSYNPRIGCSSYEVTSSSDSQMQIEESSLGNHLLDKVALNGNPENISVASHFKESSLKSEADSSDVIIPSLPSTSKGLPSDSSQQLSSSCAIDELDDDEDEVDSTISNISALSDSSNGQEWRTGPIAWVHRQMMLGSNPRTLLQELVPKGTSIPAQLDNATLWKVIANMLSEPPRRRKLPNINSLDDVVCLIRSCKQIVVLTGAGVSVSSGIPDFRSRDGIYARLSKDFSDLPDPQAMFDIHYFRKDPRPFYKFAKEIYPGQFQPSPSHRFIKLLEDHGKLLRNYTQNIDTLEKAAGIEKVITCHGSFATASCTNCKYSVECTEIKNDIYNQRIPNCPKCSPTCEELAVMKPDIVFFGEGLSDNFHHAVAEDKDRCDLLIVMGSSLKVRPVALIPSSIPSDVPQILINREPLNHLTFDVELLGNCDAIVSEICHKLGDEWTIIPGLCHPQTEVKKLTKLDSFSSVASETERKNNCEMNNNSSETKNIVSDATCSSSQLNNNWENETTSNQSCSSAISNINKYQNQDSGKCDADSTSNIKEPESTKNIEDLRAWWKPKPRESLSSRLPASHYYSMAPGRYVFTGAEIYSDVESDNESYKDDNPHSSDSSSSSDDFDFDEDDDDDDNNNIQETESDGFQRVLSSADSGFSNDMSKDEESNPISSMGKQLDDSMDDGDSGYAASKSSEIAAESVYS